MTMTNQEQYEEMCEKAKKYDELTAQRASTGYWEYVHYDPDYLVYSGTCTACKRKHESTDHVGKLPFCPHCGAQMLGERNPVLITADEDGESECGHTTDYDFPYCANCGAKMDGGKDNAE